MPVERLHLAISAALARPQVTSADVEALRAAALEDGVATETELSALRSLSAQPEDRFEPGAAGLLARVLVQLTSPSASLMAPAQPAAPQRAPEAWDSFPVAANRDALSSAAGAQTFDRLTVAVSAGTISQDERLLLASAVSRRGVMAGPNAMRAVAYLQRMTPPERDAFRELTGRATSPLIRAFIFKALAAGHDLETLKSFEATLRGGSNRWLFSKLNLADPITDDGMQTGIKQQLGASCAPTTAQALRGEVDPIYALKLRSENVDIQEADPAQPYSINPALAKEQAEVLKRAGGTANSREEGGLGVPLKRVDEIYNAHAAQTGFTYRVLALKDHPQLTMGAALDQLAAQLREGIHTPIMSGNANVPINHAMLALATEGSGEGQRFLIHDPSTGSTLWITREQCLKGHITIGKAVVTFGGFSVATPAPLRTVRP